MCLKNHLNKVILATIILVAAVLRFYDFFDLPFMWDELSALHRLQFSSFNELIEKGIKPDGHPAGVQVFLYYWIQLFGDAEWVVKLPFNLMGLASVYVFYQIAKIWFGEKSGLVATSFMATLQFFVLYSPIARPYVSGLFLTLMMVYFWSQFLFKTSSRKHLLGFILFAALSAYNHHFSLLFAAIVGFSGLLVIKKSQVKEYMIAGVLIFALYIPHLPIFFHQLGIGGIGGDGNWLSKPSSHFVFDFIEWSFQYCYLMIVLAFSLLGFSLFLYKLKSKEKWIRQMLLILWTALPIAIGYYYSTLVNPVIQYSLFIFSFPYFILLISSGAEKLKTIYLIPLIVLILSLNSYSLIEKRQHYQIIFMQPFEVTAKTTKELNKKHKTSTFTIFNTIPSYQNYYFNKYHLDTTKSYSIYKKEHSLIELDILLNQIEAESIVCCGLNPEMILLIQHRFPFLVKRINAYTMDIYVFSKDIQGQNMQDPTPVISSFPNSEEGWNINSHKMKLDSSGRSYYEFNSQEEWGCNFSDTLNHLKIEKGSTIDLIGHIYSKSSISHAIWVATFDQAEKEQVWRGQDLNLISTEKADEYKVFFSLDTQILLEPEEWDQQFFKTYLWNKGQDSFRIYDIQLQSRTPNPIKYGLFQRLH